MVHALAEIERVLAPGGALVDLRPLLDRWPVEVAWHGGAQEAARAADLKEPLEADEAANAAMAGLIGAGRMQRELQETFPLYFYWDTPIEMKEYLEEEWSETIAIDEHAWQSVRSAWAIANAEARVRLRMKMLITRYRAVAQPASQLP